MVWNFIHKLQSHRLRNYFPKKFALHWDSSAGNKRVKISKKLHQEYKLAA